MTVTELKDLLASKDLSTTGTKADLIARLQGEGAKGVIGFGSTHARHFHLSDCSTPV
jgi:uncharacterized protein YigA (DUF484 family)